MGDPRTTLHPDPREWKLPMPTAASSDSMRRQWPARSAAARSSSVDASVSADSASLGPGAASEMTSPHSVESHFVGSFGFGMAHLLETGRPPKSRQEVPDLDSGGRSNTAQVFARV